MIKRLTERLRHDEGLSWRAMRSGLWTIAGFGGGQIIRLLVNLLLARMLFPSAFGTMSLLMLVIQALNNFSDVGTRPSILRSDRGDDPDFLNTAWTIEIIRGIGLWLACCAVAVPFARFYGAPELAAYLMVAGFGTVIQGMTPMRSLTAERHMTFRQVTKADMLSQVVTSAILLLLVWATGSVWALVVMLPIGHIIRNMIILWLIPGHRDRLHWDRAAVHELTSFGKWIFPGTLMSSLLGLGDKAMLGRYLSLAQLGLYNIGFLLAAFPMMLGGAIMSRIMIPLCRESPPSEGPEQFGRIQRIRFALTGGMMATTLMVALLGPWIVGLLYDARYLQAGTILSLIACAMLPQIISMGYDNMVLAAGDSRGHFVQVSIRAVLFVSMFWLGLHFGGLYGALVGQFVASVLHYPFLALLVRRHKAWDPLHDATFAVLGLLGAALVLLFRSDSIRSMTLGA
ncbi:oligosaccharide flippase family protein [Paracoccus tegillarcae]|uniref:Polysaccharide biosynthesis protein n=1 Tax=Paracoccus tegillarcae TaxID=1529068 RepID=A0A2K9EIU4_9RHOB|nr:oligosaccharide flippase family protein [Paracoccus tegillarcae]AUH34299.1 polysaccharide biosynthesis protein [Paracoccus tegillarcae]